MTIKFYIKESKALSSSLIEPKVSITRSGNLIFNRKANSDFDLNKYGYALLGYDEESRLIAIKPLENPENGSRKITKQGENGKYLGICSVGFLHHIGIVHEVSRSYPLSKNDDGLLVFSLIK